jgi:uncharacterized protein (TIGR03066 family)
MFLALFLTCCTLPMQDKYDARQLLGKWEIDNVQPGLKAHIEFQKDDKLEISVDFQGKQQKTEGTFKLEGDVLTFTFAKEKKPRKTKVIKLNGKELIFRDEAMGEEQVLKKLP